MAICAWNGQLSCSSATLTSRHATDLITCDIAHTWCSSFRGDDFCLHCGRVAGLYPSSHAGCGHLGLPVPETNHSPEVGRLHWTLCGPPRVSWPAQHPGTDSPRRLEGFIWFARAQESSRPHTCSTLQENSMSAFKFAISNGAPGNSTRTHERTRTPSRGGKSFSTNSER